MEFSLGVCDFLLSELCATVIWSYLTWIVAFEQQGVNPKEAQVRRSAWTN